MSFGFSIGDIKAVSTLAWDLYKKCYIVARGAPQEFQLLVGEISGLSNSLKVLQEELADPKSTLIRAGEDRVRMVNEMMSRVHTTLKDLEKVAKKYEALGTGSKSKHMWMKFKWSVEFSSIDSLRSKLIYHNTVMNLLLTSVGNSSLQRIESSTIAIENDVKDIKDFLRPSLKSQTVDASAAPSLSAVNDEMTKLSLASAMMKHAEVVQPWNTIGLNQWIQSGRWWLLRSQMELNAHAIPNSAPTVSVTAYTHLIKASWILVDIISCHPQISFLDSGTRYEVQLLSAELKKEFHRIEELELEVPDLNNLDDSNLRIWESQAKGFFLRPRKNAAYLNRTLNNSWTVSGEDELFFQGFALYQRHALPEPLPCMVLFLIHKKTNVARLVTQNQNGETLMEATVQSQTSFHQDKSSVGINAENLTFTKVEDADHLCTILAATKYYFFCRSCEDVYLDDLKAFILLVAVKNQLRDTVMRLLDSHVSSNDSSEPKCYKHASVIASVLASRFMKNDLNDRLVQELERDRTQISLFSWALQCGHAAVVDLLILEKTNWSDDSGFNLSKLGLASLSGHEPVVKLLLEKEANLEMKDNSGRTALHLAASKGHQAVVRLLLQEGADFEMIDHQGKTAFLFAAENGNLKTVQLLLNMGANFETSDRAGRTALLLAAENGNLKTVQLLLNMGANFETSDCEGRTALLLAAKEGNLETVRLLLNERANIEKSDGAEMTALLHAVKNEKLEMMQLLLDAGAKFGPRYSDGWSALHHAAEYHCSAAAELLVRAGADIAGRTYEGMTALHVFLLTGLNCLQPEMVFLDLLRQPIQPSHSTAHPQRSLRRTQVHIEVYSDRAMFILDSPLAHIEFTEAVPSCVSYKDSQVISFAKVKSIGVRSPSSSPQYISTEMRFTIVHPEGSPLDFSIGRGRLVAFEQRVRFDFKVKILNWQKVVTGLVGPKSSRLLFRTFHDVLNLIPKAE